MTDGRRNVVLVTYDSLRADHCGPWGYERDTTPNLDAMADDGVLFENAIAPASRTNPSMAGIFTGEPLVVRDQVADPDHARSHLTRHGTVAEDLSAAGYATGAFCPNAYASRYYGFDRGFDTYEDFLFDESLYQSLFEEHLGDSSVHTLLRNLRNFVLRQEAFKTWDTYMDETVEWVDAQSEPFFLWTFSLDTHFPYLTPRKHRQWSSLWDQYYYNWRCNQLIDEFDIDLSAAERQKLVDIYDDSIRFGDALIAELRDRLSEYDPVVVVHGDHGEAFDERGIYGHFYPSLYEENVHVPLVVSGLDETATVEKPTTLLDLPTILRRAGGLESGDVADVGRDWVVATDYDGRNGRNLTAIRTQTLKYIRTDGTVSDRECYDLTDDRGETANRIADHPASDSLEALADRRARHETERLAIADGAAAIADTG
jgi:arylsulfatase